MQPKLLILTLLTTMLVGCEGGPGTVKTLTLTEEEQVINQQQNEFSLDLLRRVNAHEDGENVVLSPMSVAAVCAMLANGAEGNTLTQILNTIGAQGYDITDLNDYYKNLLTNLPHLDKYTDMKLADAIWVDDAYQVKDEFVKANKSYYKATVDVADLANPAMAKVINSWAKKNTKGLIPEVVDETMFTEDTRMVLANAIYFMSKWASEFDKNATKQEDFTLADGKTISVNMMNKSSKLTVTPAYQYDGFQGGAPDTVPEYYSARMLRLYFKDNAYCMDVVLPREDISCDDYLADFDMDDLNWLQNKLSNYSVQVKLPKFTIKYHRDLEEDMSAMGMTDVLNPALADLSGITDEEQLFLKKLFQDSYIAIEEEGVKAAAVTIGIVAPTAAAPTPSVEPFIVDRPFLLFIREAKYGTILFAAKIGNPSK